MPELPEIDPIQNLPSPEAGVYPVLRDPLRSARGGQAKGRLYGARTIKMKGVTLFLSYLK